MTQTTFSAMEAELRSLRELTGEQVFAGFVSAAKLCDPQVTSTYAGRNLHVWSCCAHASELARRNELPRLLPLLDSDDSWLAFCAAERLSLYEGTEDATLRALDRIVAASAEGAVTKMAAYRADRLRNGAHHPAVDS